MKKLTTSEPQAGVRRSVPRGTSGASARRRWTTNATAATAEPRRYQSPRSEKTWIFGSAVANARITPARAAARNSDPTRSASRVVRAHPGRSTSGRAAVAQRTTRSSAATIARLPTGVSQRPSPTYGMNSCPQVRSRNSSAGWIIVKAPAPRLTTSRSTPIGSGGRLRVDRSIGRKLPVSCSNPCGWGPNRNTRIATARTRPTTRLIAKITRQSAKASTTAPKSGPRTLPISWTAETTPSGTPRRSTG